MVSETYKQQAAAAKIKIDSALNEAYEFIIDVVKAKGGYLKTVAEPGKPIIHAYYEDWDGKVDETTIHGLRYDDELGLCICTNDMLDNYQFDTDYEFEYYFDFAGKDLEEVNKALDDDAYYVEFDKYDLVNTPTVISIINGIQDYL